MTEPRTLALTLPGFVPDSRLSLNGRHRTHWATLRKLRTSAGMMMLHRLYTPEPLPWMLKWARVDITFVYPIARRRDPDGLAGLAKPLLDALVSEHVLFDDDSEHVVLSVTAVVEKGVTETRIRIEEI